MNTKPFRDMSTEKDPDFWLGVWQSPQISSAVQDQRAFDEDAGIASLKKQLASFNRIDYFHTAGSAACAKQLQIIDTQVSRKSIHPLPIELI